MPLFESSASIHIKADPAQVYATVIQMTRSREWSPECVGGKWITGEPATVGAVFRGEMVRSPDAVAWAPMLRGTFYTESEVVAAEQGRTFRWAVRDRKGRAQQSVWGYDISPDGDGTRLVHHYRMDAPTEGIRGIIAKLTDAEQKKFFTEWGAKVEGDIAVTVQRIKKVIESDEAH